MGFLAATYVIGYLADKGLIPLPDDMRATVAKSAQGMEPMSKPEAH